MKNAEKSRFGASAHDVFGNIIEDVRNGRPKEGRKEKIKWKCL